jgi:hypothetical protein
MKMSWTERAEMVFSGPFVKFSNGTEYFVEFLMEPSERKFYLGGKEKTSFEFPVRINETEKSMGVTSERLMKKLMAEDKKASIIGRTLRIRALNDGTARDWEVESVIP